MCVRGGGFGDLLELDEELVPPQTSLLARTAPETLLYLCAGALSDAQTTRGTTVVLLAGGFRRVDGAATHPLLNGSATEWARVFRIRLHPPSPGLGPEPAQVWFSSAERRGRLRLVVSPTARDGSLAIPQDVLVYSSLLDPGQHVVCEVGPGRRAWLHMIRGSATVLGRVIEASDTAEIEACPAFGVTAREASEVLVFDLAEQHEETDA